MLVKKISRAQRAYWQPDILASTSVASSAVFCCENIMVDMANGQNIPLNVNISSSWHSWHADIVNMRGPRKAKFHSHGYQFRSGHRSWTTPSIDCLPDSVHPSGGDENTVTALHEDIICERGRVNTWKNGPGRKKEWRSIRYLTCKRKRKEVEFSVASLERTSKSPPKAAGVHLLIKKAPWQIAVPRNMLLQKSSSDYDSPPSPKPRSSMQIGANLGLKLEHSHRYQIWDKSDLLSQEFPVLLGSGGGSNLEDEIIDDRGSPR